LQEGVKPESFRTLNLSIVKIKEAKNPIIPAKSRVQAELSCLIITWQEYLFG
jgi:hypothetical protein